MKNILKIFILITGFALGMISEDNPLEPNLTTTVIVTLMSGELVTPEPLTFTEVFGVENVRHALRKLEEIQNDFDLVLGEQLLSNNQIMPNEANIDLKQVNRDLQTLTISISNYPDYGITFYGDFSWMHENQVKDLCGKLEEYFKCIKPLVDDNDTSDSDNDRDSDNLDLSKELDTIGQNITQVAYGSLTAIPHKTPAWKWTVIKGGNGCFNYIDHKPCLIYEADLRLTGLLRAIYRTLHCD